MHQILKTIYVICLSIYARIWIRTYTYTDVSIFVMEISYFTNGFKHKQNMFSFSSSWGGKVHSCAKYYFVKEWVGGNVGQTYVRILFHIFPIPITPLGGIKGRDFREMWARRIPLHTFPIRHSLRCSPQQFGHDRTTSAYITPLGGGLLKGGTLGKCGPDASFSTHFP